MQITDIRILYLDKFFREKYDEVHTVIADMAASCYLGTVNEGYLPPPCPLITNTWQAK